jgi:hypothetical protein
MEYDSRPKYEVISHVLESYSATGVPSVDVSIEEAPEVTELGTLDL